MIYKVGCLLRGPNGRAMATLHYAMVEAETGDDAAQTALRIIEGILAVKSIYPAGADDIDPPAAALEGEEDQTGDEAPDDETAAILALQSPETPAEAPEPAKPGKKGGKK